MFTQLFFERTNYGNVNTMVSTLPHLTDHLVPIEQHVMFKNCITKLNWKSTDSFHTATSYLFYLRHRIFNAQRKTVVLYYGLFPTYPVRQNKAFAAITQKRGFHIILSSISHVLTCYFLNATIATFR